ncbi:MAG TPA: T9SS type A sorting domain-containing protein, partial [Candidatus Kapabacteria bacterium]|nr:T9SS type A sorting domain-containing protein [Candidatus Kapabacteria bacterium]
PGTYDAEIHGNTYTGGSYDYYTTFLVNPHPIITPDNHNLPRADVDTVNLTGSGVNFISGSQDVTIVKLIKEDPDTITASKVTVTSDTSLSAFFTIPQDARPGFYDIAITEPGTNRIVTGRGEVFVKGTYQDSGYVTLPSVVTQGQTVTITTASNISAQPYCYPSDIYLQNGTSKIPGSVVYAAFPDTIIATFQIPATADTGLYSITMMLTCDSECCNFDSIPNAVNIEAPAGVADNNPLLAEINSLRVSPNPTQDNLTISFILNSPTHLRLRLFDALGRTVATLCDRNLGAGAQHFEWSARALPAGSYFYELTTGEEMHGGSIIVRH